VKPDRHAALLALLDANIALKAARAVFVRMGQVESAALMDEMSEDVNDIASALCKGAAAEQVYS
jgi:hypothetical protein